MDPDKLFGEPTDFAIEAGLEPGLARPTPVWGHMCVWCRGVALGDITNTHCGLYGAFCGFRTLLENLPDLWDESFDGLDDQGIWNRLDGLLYGYHGDIEIADDRTLEETRAVSARYGRFDFLTNWDEPFDHYKAFIMCPPPGREVRILFRVRSTRLNRADVSRAGVVTASRAFLEWFNKQEQQLRA